MGGVCTNQLEHDHLGVIAAKRPSAFSLCLQKASSHTRLPVPGPVSQQHQLASCSLIAPQSAHGRPLDVAVLGGGPAGLLLALRLVESGGIGNVNVTVIDHRWQSDQDGVFTWSQAGEPEDGRVFVLPSVMARPFTEASEATQRALLGGSASTPSAASSHVWPGSSCLSAQALKERLLQRVQEVDVSSRVSLAVGPPSYLQQRVVLGRNSARDAIQSYRVWLEALECTHLVVTADAAELVREAFADELKQVCSPSTASGMPKVSSRRRPLPLLGACFAGEGALPHNVALTAALTCAQRSYFYNTDAAAGRSCMGIRLRSKQLEQAAELLKASGGPQSGLLYASSGSGACSRAELAQKLPWLQALLTKGCRLFGVREDSLTSLTLAGMSSRLQPQAFTVSAGRGAEVCFLEESSGATDLLAALPPAWWCSGHSGCGPPTGSLAASMEAADALTRILQKRVPLEAFECFMQGLRTIDGARHHSVKSEEQGLHGNLESAVLGWRDMLQGCDSELASVLDEDVVEAMLRASDSNEITLVPSRWVVCPPETAAASKASGQHAWLTSLQGKALSRSSQLGRALEAWEILSQGLPQEALAALGGREAASPGPAGRDLMSLTVRGEALLRLGRWEEAAEDCAKALGIFSDSSMARLVQAEVNLRLGYLSDCVEDCDRVLDIVPGSSQAHALRGEARLGLGHFEEAILDCDWALAHGRRAASVLTVRGRAHLKLGNLREAVCDAEEAEMLRESPTCSEALLVRGQAMLEFGDSVSAMADLTKAIETPDVPREVKAMALALRAEVLVSVQRFDQAVIDCDQALKLSSCPLALAIRGEAKLLSCEYRGALEDCNAALVLEPDDSYTLTVRAEAHLCLQHAEEAINDCDQALELEPGNEYAVRVRDRACSKG